MPHGYCTECRARVTAVDGRCLLGHAVDQSTISSRRGRRISGTSSAETNGSVSVLERVLPERSPAAISSPVTPTNGIPATPTRPAPARSQRQPGDRVMDSAEHRPLSIPGRQQTGPELRSHRTASAGVDLNPTGEMVIKLWDRDQDVEDDVFGDWHADEAMADMPERSGPRIVSAVLLVLAVIAVVVSVTLLFGNRGSEEQQLIAATHEFSAALDRFDPTVDSNFAEIDETARRVLESAQALEVGDPRRAVAIDAATQVLEGERTLSAALAYQTRFSVFMGRPALPTATDDVGAVSATFTEWSSAIIQALEPVPNQPAFGAHADLVRDFSERLQRLQARYLDALRAGDAAAATETLAALDGRVGAVETSVAESVTGARTDFAATITDAEDLLASVPAQQ